MRKKYKMYTLLEALKRGEYDCLLTIRGYKHVDNKDTLVEYLNGETELLSTQLFMYLLPNIDVLKQNRMFSSTERVYFSVFMDKNRTFYAREESTGFLVKSTLEERQKSLMNSISNKLVEIAENYRKYDVDSRMDIVKKERKLI